MTTKTELATQPITEIQKLFSDGAFSPHDLLDRILENIQKREVKVHAYLYIEPEEKLRKEADEADIALKNGKGGLICGIPIAVKDNTYVAGMPCTGGSRLLEDSHPKEDASAISKLRSEGGIMLGKTNLDEMAAFSITTNNPHYGRTYNPWNLTRIPGGSSGGSAAAVAAGEAVAATGTDTGGSVRIPASFCGLTGIKPTFGRLSRAGTLSASWSLDHLGVISRSVRDAELLIRIIAGEDPRDPTTTNTPLLQKFSFLDHPDLKGLKIGTVSNLIHETDKDVTELFQESVDKIASLGATISKVKVPRMEEITPLLFAIALPETSAYHEQWLRDSPELYGSELRSYVELGHGILATQYLKAKRIRTAIIDEVAKALQDVDALLLPTTPTIAPHLEQLTYTIQNKEYPAIQVLASNTYPFNFLGLPALSVPNGFVEGMPTGLQIVASQWREDVLYRIGDAYQQVTDYHKKAAML